jgi:hypothetical protein
MNLDRFLSNFHSETWDMSNNGRFHESIYIAEHLTVQSLNCLGLVYSTNYKYHKKALDCFYRALKIDPGNWHLWSNIVHVFSLTGQNEKAVIAANEAIKFARGQAFDPYYNSGVVLANLGRLEESEKMYKLALELNPSHATASFNLALVLLRQGKYAEGFNMYDWRFKSSDITKRFKERFLQDHWDGRKFKKKSLLIYSEQGLGDFILFSRFIEKAKSLGEKVIVEVQEPLVNIVRDNFNVDVVLPRANNNDWPNAPESDYCISVCSLPKVLKIDNKEKILHDPYIKPKNKMKLKSVGKKLKVGICWCGNPDHKRDHTRSTYVSSFKPLTENKKIQCYGLLKGVPSKRSWPDGKVDLSTGLSNMNVINLEDKIQNFDDLASAIDAMDLVITVDTGLAHLAGAMGKPTWLLIGSETDWRWMDNADTTPWYPSMKIFRYKTSWSNLIKEVVEALP